MHVNYHFLNALFVLPTGFQSPLRLLRRGLFGGLPPLGAVPAGICSPHLHPQQVACAA